jgi:hypothetical protein
VDEVVVANFKELSRHLSGKSEGKNKDLRMAGLLSEIRIRMGQDSAKSN